MSEEINTSEEVIVKQKARKSEFNLPTAIVVAGALIALAILVRADGSTSGGQEALDLIPGISETDFVRGNPDAPVTIIEYADFKCPACAAYHPILQKLVDESNGQVKWSYRDFPIFSQESAGASRCVGKLGGNDSFWTYTDILFKSQSFISSDFLKDKAIELGISSEAYDSCLNDPTLVKAIDREYNRLKYLVGLTSTPTTVIIDGNGRKYMFTGALYQETLVDIIETLDK